MTYFEVLAICPTYKYFAAYVNKEKCAFSDHSFVYESDLPLKYFDSSLNFTMVLFIYIQPIMCLTVC